MSIGRNPSGTLFASLTGSSPGRGSGCAQLWFVAAGAALESRQPPRSQAPSAARAMPSPHSWRKWPPSATSSGGGPPVMQAIRQMIRGCPPPLEVAEGGHFLQEWGEGIARAALGAWDLGG